MLSTELSRYEQLLIWLRRNDISIRKLAKKMSISAMSVSRLARAERISIQRRTEFLELGIPPDLLPEGIDVKRGPKTSKNLL